MKEILLPRKSIQLMHVEQPNGAVFPCLVVGVDDTLAERLTFPVSHIVDIEALTYDEFQVSSEYEDTTVRVVLPKILLQTIFPTMLIGKTSFYVASQSFIDRHKNQPNPYLENDSFQHQITFNYSTLSEEQRNNVISMLYQPVSVEMYRKFLASPPSYGPFVTLHSQQLDEVLGKILDLIIKFTQGHDLAYEMLEEEATKAQEALDSYHQNLTLGLEQKKSILFQRIVNLANGTFRIDPEFFRGSGYENYSPKEPLASPQHVRNIEFDAIISNSLKTETSLLEQQLVPLPTSLDPNTLYEYAHTPPQLYMPESILQAYASHIDFSLYHSVEWSNHEMNLIATAEYGVKEVTVYSFLSLLNRLEIVYLLEGLTEEETSVSLLEHMFILTGPALQYHSETSDWMLKQGLRGVAQGDNTIYNTFFKLYHYVGESDFSAMQEAIIKAEEDGDIDTVEQLTELTLRNSKIKQLLEIVQAVVSSAIMNETSTLTYAPNDTPAEISVSELIVSFLKVADSIKKGEPSAFDATAIVERLIQAEPDGTLNLEAAVQKLVKVAVETGSLDDILTYL